MQGAGPIPRTGRPLAEGGSYLVLVSVPEALDVNVQPLLTMDDQKNIQKLHQGVQRHKKMHQ